MALLMLFPTWLACVLSNLVTWHVAVYMMGILSCFLYVVWVFALRDSAVGMVNVGLMNAERRSARGICGRICAIESRSMPMQYLALWGTVLGTCISLSCLHI